jgi:hypothetical protein
MTERDDGFDAADFARAVRSGSHAVAAASVVAFVEGGRATFTLVNARTGGRYTYRVERPDGGRLSGPRFFVSVLDGPDNTRDYTYIGCVWPEIRDGDNALVFRHGRKSRLAADAVSVLGFEWFWPRRARLAGFPHVKVYHMGSCGRCGRALTVPESIITGLGPVCAEKAGRA